MWPHRSQKSNPRQQATHIAGSHGFRLNRRHGYMATSYITHGNPAPIPESLSGDRMSSDAIPLVLLCMINFFSHRPCVSSSVLTSLRLVSGAELHRPGRLEIYFFLGVPRMYTEYYTASGQTKFIAPVDKDGWSPYILIKLHEPKQMWLDDRESVLTAAEYDVYIHTTRESGNHFVMGLIELCNTIKEFDISFGKKAVKDVYAGDPPALTQADLQGGSDNE